MEEDRGTSCEPATAADASAAGIEPPVSHIPSEQRCFHNTTTMNSSPSSSSRQAPSLPSPASSSWESLKSYVGNVTSQVSDLVLRGLDSVAAERNEQAFGGPRNGNNKLFLYIPADNDATSDRDSEPRR
jgi:hypothetical protein